MLVASILNLGISQNTNCDNLVGFLNQVTYYDRLIRMIIDIAMHPINLNGQKTYHLNAFIENT